MASTTVPEQVQNLLATYESIALEPNEEVARGGASQADIQQLQTEVGVTLPGELASWLALRNGSFVGGGRLFSCAEIAVAAVQMAERRDAFNETFGAHPAGIPIASDGSGSAYVLSDSGFVYFSDHEGPWYVVASSLWRFLACWLEDESGRSSGQERHWPFDQEWTEARDPELTTISNNPWSTPA